jgi:hypothetical protein
MELSTALTSLQSAAGRLHNAYSEADARTLNETLERWMPVFCEGCAKRTDPARGGEVERLDQQCKALHTALDQAFANTGNSSYEDAVVHQVRELLGLLVCVVPQCKSLLEIGDEKAQELDADCGK